MYVASCIQSALQKDALIPEIIRVTDFLDLPLITDPSLSLVAQLREKVLHGEIAHRELHRSPYLSFNNSNILRQL